MAKTDGAKLPDLSRLTGFNVLTVMHDDWCRLLLGLGDCNCNPTFGSLVEITDDIEAEAERIAADNRRTSALRKASRN